jgi:photosystem II stability/assembly factor-like uncharacterized protein
MNKFLFMIWMFLSFFIFINQGYSQTNTNKSINDTYTNDNDPDIPPFAKNMIDKGEYLHLRQDYINSLRGVPYNLPYNPRVKAIETMRGMELRKNGPGALVQSANWTFLGPSPIPNGQTTTFTVPVSGRVTCIAINPTNENIVYVGTAQGGVFRTLDGGSTWTSIFDNAQSMSVGCLALAPSDPTILYVGTGEANFSADSYFGVGIYRINNADTSPVLNGPINPSMTMTINGVSQSVQPFFNKGISKILVHPTNPAIIFVSTTYALGGEVDAFAPYVCPEGIFVSNNATSAPGSVTFTKLTVNTENSNDTPPTGDRAITDMALEPGNPNNLLCFFYGTTASDGVYRSTNALSGTPTFTKTFASTLSGDRGKFDIVKIGSVVTVVLGNGESSTVCSGLGRIRKSTDGGATWSAELAGFGGFCSGQCWYDISLAIDPTNASLIMVGGSATGDINSPCISILKRSVDGGATASPSEGGLHADNHALAFSLSNPNIVYCGTDGGIFKSTDKGATWSSLNKSGFSATQFQSLAMHPTNVNFLMGGTQDNGTILRRGNSTWFRADYGDGGYALIDQNATDTSNVTAYHTYYNIANAMGFARITTMDSASDGNWRFYGCGFQGSLLNGMTCTASAIQFYAPMTLGGGNPNTLYFGSDVLYRSSNLGVTMTKVSQTLSSGFAISTISVSKLNDNVRIVGLTNGTVWATTTGANPLVSITPSGAPSVPVGRVLVDPVTSSTAYLCYGGFGVTGGQHVYKTTNLAGGSASWVAIGASLPDVPVNAIAVDPSNNNIVYLGTDVGVFASTDGGSTWTSFNTGLPVVAIFDIGISPVNGALRVSTHGRGIWENTNSPLPVNLTSFTVNAQKFGNILLEWYTATEQNNHGFDIERAVIPNDKSALQWNKISFVPGEGNSNSPQKYDYIDKNPTGGAKFAYRLKQIDNSGNFKYYDQQEITLALNDFGLYQNYPNPFNPSTVIKYQLPADANVKIRLFNSIGEELKTLVNENKKAGIYEFQFNASGFASGIYYYRIDSGNFTDTKKLVILK